MAVQNSIAVRNARIDSDESVIGASPFLDIRTGAQPVNCAAAAAGTLIAHIALPADWLAAASSGTKDKIGVWAGTVIAAGTAAHYRIMDNGNTVCHEQGAVSAIGGGGDLELVNIVLSVSETITIDTASFTAGNA